MSRHRDVRSMNYSDEYDGYDDVYGHSVEDDYCVSPGAEQFLYDRNKKQDISSFVIGPDIKEDNEEIDEEPEIPKRPELSELDTVKLMSCIEVVRNVIGDTMSEAILTDKIIKANFNAEIALDEILKSSSPETGPDTATIVQRAEPQSGFTSKTFHNSLNSGKISNLKLKSSLTNTAEKCTTGFSSLSELMKSHKPNSSNFSVFSTPKKYNFNSLSELMTNNSEQDVNSSNREKLDSVIAKKPFGTLADLTADHLQKSDSPSGKKLPFVIPKFSTNFNKLSDDSTNSLSIPTSLKSEKSPTKAVDSLEENLINMQLSSDSISKENEKSEDEDEIENAEEWIIDLTSAINYSQPFSVTENEKLKTQDYDDLNDIYVITADPIPSSMIVQSLKVLECEYNASDLRYRKISYTNKSGSFFGKMLCRRWRSRTPYVKSPEPEFTGKVKSFDFTSPSPDSIITARLKKKNGDKSTGKK